MIILAFDTCLDKMYAVLQKDDKVLASRVIENHDNKYHSAFLISTLQEILSENNMKPQDVDLIATNIGPGSFTGIRACVTVARVMAQQLSCKAVGISSLEILAKASKSSLVALDARKNSAYLYVDEEIKGAVQLEEVQKIINTGKYKVLTDDKLQSVLGGISYQQMELPIGETLADLAKNKNGDWRLLKPLYIQPPPMG
jgi:tRNA threonylcarbamoyladenosine biosynthesis protein TsaB